MNNKVNVFIPAFNEGENIEHVINNLKKVNSDWPIYIIDDGSTDDTYDKAIKSGVNVLKHYINLGGGAAIRTAFRLALLNDAKYIVTLDADGQHDPIELLNMFKIMEKENPSLLIGSRFLNNNKIVMEGYRNYGINFFSKIVSFFTGVKITDVTSCYRIYDAKIIKKILHELRENQYYALELIFKISRNKGKIIEVPIMDISRLNGDSKKGILTYGYNLLRVIVKNLL